MLQPTIIANKESDAQEHKTFLIKKAWIGFHLVAFMIFCRSISKALVGFSSSKLLRTSG
jgi:hypothetical protein